MILIIKYNDYMVINDSGFKITKHYYIEVDFILIINLIIWLSIYSL